MEGRLVIHIDLAEVLFLCYSCLRTVRGENFVFERNHCDLDNPRSSKEQIRDVKKKKKM
jgi:hypothetical protein